MEPGVVVRPADPDDLDGWLALFEEVAAEGRWIGAEAPIDRAWARRSFARSAVLVAVDGGDVVGHLGITVVAGCAEIGMMVQLGRRRRGIGSALLDACLAWCREHGAHKVALTVWPHNEPAIALYERYGFVVEGRLIRHVRRRDGAQWDLLAMGLLLDRP